MAIAVVLRRPQETPVSSSRTTSIPARPELSFHPVPRRCLTADVAQLSVLLPVVDVLTSQCWRLAVLTTSTRWNVTAGQRSEVLPWTPSSIPSVVETINISVTHRPVDVKLRPEPRSVLSRPVVLVLSVVPDRSPRTRKEVNYQENFLKCNLGNCPKINTKKIQKFVCV